MKLELVTPPVKEPVDLVTAKLHLRIDESAEASVEDSLLASYITAAREHVEEITRRKLFTQTWDYSIDGWPRCNYIKLPFGNLQNVALTQSVKWKDEDGDETTLTVTTDYLWQTKGDQCGRVVLPYGESWPSGTLYPEDAITIRFVCGWTTAELVPYTIKAAILLICGDLYENREATLSGSTVQTYIENKAVQRLLASSRLWDEF